VKGWTFRITDRRHARIVSMLLLGLGFASCRRAPEEPAGHETPAAESSIPLDVSGDAALAEVRNIVALGPRVSGSHGAERAAAYLQARLESIGLDPLSDAFERETPAGTVVFRNVTAVIPGTRRQTVILASHYDTKAGISDTFTGANDSGSSSGLLLSLASRLATTGPHPFDIIIAFLDGEECAHRYGPADGLHGSRRLARTLVRNERADRVRAVIVLDMIGDRDLNIMIPRNSTPGLVTLAFTAAKSIGLRHTLTLGRTAILDDHVPFLEAGMPAIDLIDFEYGSRPGKNDYWHTPEDTLDKLSAESLEKTGRITLAMLRALAAVP
jgi:glutaminyl-peptide cyclotransferase